MRYLGDVDEKLLLLSEAEKRVARGVAQGLTNPQIAEQLVCSPWTVQTHMKRIFKKLSIQRRSQLAFLAAREWDSFGQDLAEIRTDSP